MMRMVTIFNGEKHELISKQEKKHVKTIIYYFTK